MQSYLPNYLKNYLKRTVFVFFHCKVTTKK